MWTTDQTWNDCLLLDITNISNFGFFLPIIALPFISKDSELQDI